MKISIIIPNYNGAALIEKNLPKVLDAVSDQKDIEVIIADDASRTDEQIKLAGIVRHVKETSKIPVTLIQHKKNKGFASNVDSGAFASNADYLVFLNTDVAPKKGFIKFLLEDFKKNKNLFGVGCMDESIEGNIKVLRGRGTASWKRGFLTHQRGEINKTDTFWVSGGSSMVRRSMFEKIGGLDPLYNPFYWEDIDLSYKAQKAGYDLFFEKRSVVVHDHARGAIKKHFSENDIKTIAYRNQLIFIWKNITDAKLILWHFLWLPYHVAKAAISFDGAFLLGICLALSKLPGIINTRERQKRLWIRRDSEIIQ